MYLNINFLPSKSTSCRKKYLARMVIAAGLSPGPQTIVFSGSISN